VTASLEECNKILQLEADAAAFDEQRGSPWNRPILNRICDYSAIILSPLNMRIRALSLITVSAERIVLKASGSQNIAIVFAPVEQLAAEVYIRRIAAHKHLPFPQVIKSDLTYNTLPVAYVISTYLPGGTLDGIADTTLQRVGARQVGRALRALHGNPAQGFGAPTPTGQWKNHPWPTVLREWLTTRGTIDVLADTVGPHMGKRFWDTWLRQALFTAVTPVVIHGDVDPKYAHVSVSSHIQLDGIACSGLIVGGDGMFDVAASMRTGYHPEFRAGFNEGYTATSPLTPAEVARIKQYLLIFRVIDALADVSVDRESLATSIKHATATLDT
jgi:hypothetical protein